MRTLSLAAGTMLDVGPAVAVDVAADAGFASVGVWFDPATWTAAVGADVRARADARGMTLLDFEPIMLTPEGSSTPDHGEAIVDGAQLIGARNILVASRDPDDARVAARLHALAERLDGTDIRIVLEFLPILAVRTLPQAAGIVAAADHPRLGILIDALHLSRAGHQPSDLAGLDPSLFPYLQFCDAPAETAASPNPNMPPLLYEALHGRLLPGDGALPLAQLLDAIPNVPISLELRSAALMAGYPDPTDRARAVRMATERTVAALAERQ
jgi:sugar phosphate isomerase/epimerase